MQTQVLRGHQLSRDTELMCERLRFVTINKLVLYRGNLSTLDLIGSLHYNWTRKLLMDVMYAKIRDLE